MKCPKCNQEMEIRVNINIDGEFFYYYCPCAKTEQSGQEEKDNVQNP